MLELLLQKLQKLLKNFHQLLKALKVGMTSSGIFSVFFFFSWASCAFNKGIPIERKGVAWTLLQNEPCICYTMKAFDHVLELGEAEAWGQGGRVGEEGERWGRSGKGGGQGGVVKSKK